MLRQPRLFTLPLVLVLLAARSAPAAAADSCQTETAGIVAELRAGDTAPHSDTEIEFARRAALLMCQRLGAGASPSTAAASVRASPADPAARAEAGVSTDDRRTTLFGIPIGSSERTEGHKRLLRRSH